MAGKSTLGTRLRQARLERKVKLIDLANKVGVKPPIIGDYERGRRGTKHPNIAMLVNIAEELDVSIDWLIMGEEKKHKNK